MSLPMCPLLMPVFLLIGGSSVPVKAFDTQTQKDCPYDSGCQAMVKLMAAVNEINENFYKQAEDVKELKEHLEILSADLLRHDERLKAHVESTTLQSKCQQNYFRATFFWRGYFKLLEQGLTWSQNRNELINVLMF